MTLELFLIKMTDSKFLSGGFGEKGLEGGGAGLVAFGSLLNLKKEKRTFYSKSNEPSMNLIQTFLS